MLDLKPTGAGTGTAVAAREDGVQVRANVYPVQVAGVGIAIPEGRLTNADLERMVETTDEWIVSRTGIRERRIAPPDVATSDLALAAARAALNDAAMEPGEIDLIIVATITPDHSFPATACLVQAGLGIANIPAYDLSAGCSGLAYAIDQAWHALSSGAYKNALVIGADTLSRIVDFTDRRTCVLFGDGAAALVLSRREPGATPGILASNLGADGRGGSLLILPAGGSRLPASHATVAARQHYLQMNGQEVFKFAVRILEESTRRVLAKAGLTVDDLDLFIPHQANIRIIEAARERLGIPPERVIVNVDHYGNTSAASIGLALAEALQEGRLRPGMLVAMTGFGTGLTWGSILLRWTKEPNGTPAVTER
ncbi:MAG: ketoacyl-ACP synthase III [Limnochordales bacterium]|nr:ketoacyl-ACP synthase III [Limnochordales bacterium]